MSPLTAFILGVIQGLTEFLPISSSTHLKIAKMFFGVGHIPKIFDLACHLGTLFAMVWFFRKDVLKIFGNSKQGVSQFALALSPLIPGYFVLAPLREYASNPQFLGIFLLLTSAILFSGYKVRLKQKNNVFLDSFCIGVMQSMALIPGISRSASTISCAQVLGWKPKDAVRFSFMLAIPTIIGANLIEIEKLWKAGKLIDFLNLNCFIGFIFSFLVGMLVIRMIIPWLEKGRLNICAWYCLILGICMNLYTYLQK